MRIEAALNGVTRMFLDTAPVIYEVERHPDFVAVVDPIFDRLDTDITSVISPITLAECLVGPLKSGLSELEQAYLNLLNREDVVFVASSAEIAHRAAQIRVQHNLQLADALQIATALQAGCEAFLTNDEQLKRVTTLRMVVVKELEV